MPMLWPNVLETHNDKASMGHLAVIQAQSYPLFRSCSTINGKMLCNEKLDTTTNPKDTGYNLPASSSDEDRQIRDYDTKKNKTILSKMENLYCLSFNKTGEKSIGFTFPIHSVVHHRTVMGLTRPARTLERYFGF